MHPGFINGARILNFKFFMRKNESEISHGIFLILGFCEGSQIHEIWCKKKKKKINFGREFV